MIQIDEKKHNGPKIFALIIALLVILLIAGTAKYFVDQRSSSISEVEKQLIVGNIDAWFDAGDYDTAIRDAEAYLVKYPNDVNAYVTLANAYLQKGSIEFEESENADKAIELLSVAMTLDPGDARIYELLGYSYEIKEDYSRAIGYYDQAVELVEGNSDALGSRGHMYELSGDYTKAEADYNESLSYDPENELTLINLAKLYMKTDRTETYDVEGMLDKVLAISNSDRNIATALQVLGVLYSERGDEVEARALFNDALGYDDRLTSAWMGRAFSDLNLLASGLAEDESEEELLFDAVMESVLETLEINENQATAYMIGGIVMGMVGESDPEREFYVAGLESVDNDITLGANEKEAVRAVLEELIADVDADTFDSVAARAALLEVISEEEIQAIINENL